LEWVLFFFRFGYSEIQLSALALQKTTTGHTEQSGDLGLQTKAPSSILLD